MKYIIKLRLNLIKSMFLFPSKSKTSKTEIPKQKKPKPKPVKPKKTNKKKNHNIFKIHKTKTLIQKISLTSVLLSLVLIFEGLSHFMPFFTITFLKFNFSTLFILPIFYFAGPKFGFISLFIRLFTGPLIGMVSNFGGGYVFDLIGQAILFAATILYILFLYLFSFFNIKGIKGFIITGTMSVILTSLSMSILNACLFTPWYFNAYHLTPHLFDFPSIFNQYQKIFYPFIRIKSYWIGITTLYLIFNLINFSAIHFLLYFISKPIRSIYLKK